MVKALAFVLVLTLVSMSAAQTPLDGLKNFVLGYFTGFQESTYNLTSTCLPPAFQTQIQADWEGIFEEDNIEKIVVNAFKFEKDLEQLNEDCLLWVLPVSLIASLEDKGLDTIKDFIEHFASITLDLSYAVSEIDSDPFEAGRYFGTALGYFLEQVPVGVSRRLTSVGYKPNLLDGIANFTNGLVHGLQANTTGTSQCLTSYSTIQTGLSAMGSVVFHCALLDMTACDQLGISIENVLMVLVSFSTNCNFSKLFSDFAGLMTIDGWVTLYKNMYWYQTQIRSSYSAMLTAYAGKSYYNVGLNLGNILKLAFSFTVK